MENDLVRFILARLDDDDRQLKKLHKAQASNGNGNGTGNGTGASDAFPSLDRVATESAARREIVGVLQRLLVLRDLPSERPVREGAAEVLRRLALAYGDHVGYREEWKPKRTAV